MIWGCFVNSKEYFDHLISDPGVSYFVKETLRNQYLRDPVDMLNDISALGEYWAMKCDEILQDVAWKAFGNENRN